MELKFEAQQHDGAAGAMVPALTIVLPTYCEAGNVGPMVEALAGALGGVSWEVIFVDDDSPDGTTLRARELGQRDGRVRCIRRIGRRGRASACIEGMMAAQAPIVAVMDADLQHDAAALPRMLDALADPDVDLVVGSRYAEGGSAPGLKGMRRRISHHAGRLARRLLRLRLSDPTSGYFMVRRQLVDRFVTGGAADGFNTMLDIATSRKLKPNVVEVPYRFAERLSGDSKFSPRQAMEFAALLVSRLTDATVPQRFVVFCAIGAVGVLVHLVALALALNAGAPFGIAQSAATLVAIVNNYLLNNVLTFRDRQLAGLARLRGLLIYALICSFGAVSNVSIAAWLFANESVWWGAGLAGAAVSAVWNYAASSTMVWRK